MNLVVAALPIAVCILLLCSNSPVNAQSHLVSLQRDLSYTTSNNVSCGYDADLSGTFPLVYGRNQVQAGTVTVTLTSNKLVVKYNMDHASGCKLNAYDSIHVLLTSTEPKTNLAPGQFPCQSKTNGGRRQTLTCPVSRFAFQCCGPLDVYTHAALTCAGGKSEPAYAGARACTKLTKWCNVARLYPSCDCQCDEKANKCKTKSACATCGELVCPATTACKDKISCSDCGEAVCPAGTPKYRACATKSKCDACGEEVCPAGTPNEGTCVTKKDCDCGPDVCPAADCEACVRTFNPSGSPSVYHSSSPSVLPSTQPSSKPSKGPSTIPSGRRSGDPSSRPSDTPFETPSSKPSLLPSNMPSIKPSVCTLLRI
jgi:hypothetical protein